MKKLVVLLMVSLMATSAFATLDPDPNMMGFYFDELAMTNGTAVTPGVQFSVYLMLTNSTYPEISGFECNYELVGGAGSYFRLVENIYGGLNVGNSTNAAAGNYVVGWPAPRAAGTVLPLAQWTMLFLAPAVVDVYLRPATIPSLPTGTPVIEVGGSLAPVGYSTGGAEFVNAVMGGTGPVAEEIESFGGVKALFR